MADRIEAVTVTTAASTLASAPATTTLPPNNETVTEIQIVIPTGHVGLTGIKIFYGNDQMVPFRGSDWLLGNGQELRFPIEGYPIGAKWSAQTYNTDLFDHQHYVRILVDNLPEPPVPPQLPLSNIVGASLSTTGIETETAGVGV